MFALLTTTAIPFNGFNGRKPPTPDPSPPPSMGSNTERRPETTERSRRASAPTLSALFNTAPARPLNDIGIQSIYQVSVLKQRLQSQINANQETVKSYELKLTEKQERINHLESRINSLETYINSIESKQKAFEVHMAELETHIAEVESGAVAGGSEDVKKKDQEIAKLLKELEKERESGRNTKVELKALMDQISLSRSRSFNASCDDGDDISPSHSLTNSPSGNYHMPTPLITVTSEGKRGSRRFTEGAQRLFKRLSKKNVRDMNGSEEDVFGGGENAA